MDYQVALTCISHNKKTGPIPVSTTESKTCPSTCGMFKECYAKFGHLSIHWDAVDRGDRGLDWNGFCAAISILPKGQLWRHNQAGDLPGDGTFIDADALRMLVQANAGKRGFTYTHYPLNEWNVACIRAANAHGFTINISCDTLAEADRVHKQFPDLPQAVVLPSMTEVHSLYTRQGTHVVVCPATYRDDMNCARCGVCQEGRENRAVIGFPAHGTKKRVIDIKLEVTDGAFSGNSDTRRNHG